MSPPLAALVAEWLLWIATSGAISPRSGRALAPKTVTRYEVSWAAFLRLLPKAGESQLNDLSRGFVSHYRATRKAEGVSGGTINRDLAALTSFFRWLREEKGMATPPLGVVRERESRGRERWLNPAEIAKLEQSMEPKWWPLFATLLYTGLRIGEAQGLIWGEVSVRERMIQIRERSGRRLKSAASARVVPVPEPLTVLLIKELGKSGGFSDPVFLGEFGDYWAAARAFRRATKKAGLIDVTIHDLRHTFGVHLAQAGVPLPRIQKLMGHASPVMTMRYMAHAPESYFQEDAARLTASMSATAALAVDDIELGLRRA
jgi:integrase